MPLLFSKNNHTFIKLPIWALALFLTFSLFSICVLFYHFAIEDSSANETSQNPSNGIRIVLDPGHGGEDPGKVGINNALEKDINLSIALQLKTLLENKGFTVYLTREDDSAPSSKKEDMNARMELIKEIMPTLIVSIHQNSYTDESVCGPQVFYYSDSAEGKNFAQVMQNEINNYLNPIKRRVSQANNNYYLLKESPSPIVIVECGFLSNQAEADLLASEAYQQKMARAIYFGIITYTDQEDSPESNTSDDIESSSATDAS